MNAAHPLAVDATEADAEGWAVYWVRQAIAREVGRFTARIWDHSWQKRDRERSHRLGFQAAVRLYCEGRERLTAALSACSFCSRPEEQTLFFVRGPDAAICGHCLGTYTAWLLSPQARPEHVAARTAPETRAHTVDAASGTTCERAFAPGGPA